MLVLKRKVDESICLGDDIVVTVLKLTDDGGVSLGVTAPRSTPVHRQEVYDRIREQPGGVEG